MQITQQSGSFKKLQYPSKAKQIIKAFFYLHTDISLLQRHPLEFQIPPTIISITIQWRRNLLEPALTSSSTGLSGAVLERAAVPENLE
jgi:hypothetical protein